MTSKEKIRDIKSVINEFYHNMKCNNELTNASRECWLMYQKYCEEIQKDLEHLEELEEKHKKLSIEIDELLDDKLELVVKNKQQDILITELIKYKKALDKACEKIDYTCPVEEELMDDLDCDNCDNNCKECWKKYFLKEVLDYEN